MNKRSKKRAAELCDAVALVAQCMASNPYATIHEILALLVKPSLCTACDDIFWWCWDTIPRVIGSYTGVELCGEIECRMRECVLREGYADV